MGNEDGHQPDAGGFEGCVLEGWVGICSKRRDGRLLSFCRGCSRAVWRCDGPARPGTVQKCVCRRAGGLPRRACQPHSPACCG